MNFGVLSFTARATRHCLGRHVYRTLFWSVAAVAMSVAPSAAGPGGHRARVAADVAQQVATGATSDVIVRGTPDVIYDLAQRHGLRIKRTLKSGAVVELNSAGLAALAGDPGVPAIAADRLIRPTMAVTTEATGVDQVWRGIERIGRFTGQGIGVAIIDSGVTEVSDLQGRIAVHVDFVGQTGRGRDFYGHGTHIAGIIAPLRRLQPPRQRP